MRLKGAPRFVSVHMPVSLTSRPDRARLSPRRHQESLNVFSEFDL